MLKVTGFYYCLTINYGRNQHFKLFCVFSEGDLSTPTIFNSIIYVSYHKYIISGELAGSAKPYVQHQINVASPGSLVTYFTSHLRCSPKDEATTRLLQIRMIPFFACSFHGELTHFPLISFDIVDVCPGWSGAVLSVL